MGSQELPGPSGTGFCSLGTGRQQVAAGELHSDSKVQLAEGV